LLVLLLPALPLLAAPERWHRVQRGESLYGLARKYGVSVADLAERNGLKTTAGLRVGQKLAIPSPEAAQTAPPPPALPSSVRKAIAAAPVKAGRWQRIVLHHSATREATIQAMNQYHLKQRHMENGLAYHFVIGNGRGMRDGEIYVGNRWKKQLDGGHLASAVQNGTSLGICLVGNFSSSGNPGRRMKPDKPTKAQLDALHDLLCKLCRKYHLRPQDVVRHRDLAKTACPGDRFPYDAVIRRLGQSLGTMDEVRRARAAR